MSRAGALAELLGRAFKRAPGAASRIYSEKYPPSSEPQRASPEEEERIRRMLSIGENHNSGVSQMSGATYDNPKPAPITSEERQELVNAVNDFCQKVKHPERSPFCTGINAEDVTDGPPPTEEHNVTQSPSLENATNTPGQ